MLLFNTLNWIPPLESQDPEMNNDQSLINEDIVAETKMCFVSEPQFYNQDRDPAISTR